MLWFSQWKRAWIWGYLALSSLEGCKESHQESLRTLQSQNHPGSIERAVLSRAELIRDPCHSDLKCSERPQWFGEKQEHQLSEEA